MGPRSCNVCGPRLEPCWRCHATEGHRHVVVVDRHGATLSQVAVCDLHAPPAVPDAPWDKTPPEGLSAVDVRILDVIEGLTLSRGFPPTVREVGDAVGLSSSSSVHGRLAGLRERGLVSWREGSSRTLAVVSERGAA